MQVLVRALWLVMVGLVLVPDAAYSQADERTTFVSVVDEKEVPVTGLAPADFIVREDGMAREVLRSSPANEPMQIALLVDTSQAIENYILDIRLGLTAFLKQMGGKHEIALIGFGERPTIIVDYTRDTERLLKGLANVYPRQGSGTYLLDAIIDAGQGLQRRKAPRGHIVVFAARGREFSDRYHQNVLDRLQETGPTLHTFVLTRTGTAPMDRETQELEMTIADGTRMTGGRREDLLTVMSLSDRLTSLGVELNGQYQVTYARPKTLIPPKTMEVTVKRTDVTVRARRWP